MFHTVDFPAICESLDVQDAPHVVASASSKTEISYDSLTGLLDRKSFISVASDLISSYRTEVAFAVADLDGLKRANDRFGHAFGDRYIKKFSSILATLSSDCCYVGRLGGDEFAIIFSGKDAQCALARISEICQKFESVDLENDIPSIGGVSVGLCLPSEIYHSFDEIYYKSDVALYAAKESGRGQVKIYSNFVMKHFDVEHQKELLKAAVVSGALSPSLQPVVRIKTGEVIGYEALARIQFSDGKILTPNKFLKGLRDRECAKIVSMRMVELCLHSWSSIRMCLPQDARLSINVTEHDISDLDLYNFIDLSLSKNSLDWSDITLEILETAVTQEDFKIKSSVLRKFQSKGVKIALDDFGTGYATLTHLADFPVDIVKIDKSLIKEATHNDRARKIMGFILKLADSLELEVIAEGVERELDLEVAIDEGAQYAQGNYFGRPQCARLVVALETTRYFLNKSNEILPRDL